MFVKNRNKYLFSALAVAVTLAVVVTAVYAEDKQEAINFRFEGRAVNMSDVGPSGQTTIEIQVDRWSSEAQREALWQILVEKGQNDFRDALANEPSAGWVRIAQGAERTAPRTVVGYSREFKEGDKWDIVLVTDRPIGFGEAMSQVNKSLRFSISIITLQLTKDASGKWRGDGQMIVGAELNVNKEKNKLEVKNFSSRPVVLQSIALRE